MSDRPAQPAIARVLARVAFAPSAADVERVRRRGFAAYVDEQLAWQALDDAPLAANLERVLPTLAFDRAGLVAQAHGEAPRRAQIEWRAATRARRNASRRQLYEVMVEFWTRWFGLPDGVDTLLHERDVVRAHALGRYADLLRASARSTAMLARERRRWLDDLTGRHSRGLAAGDADLDEAERCFSGWTLDAVDGTPCFVAARHDYGAKRVFGTLLPAGGGADDGDALIDRLAADPATARHVARRLVRRFVGAEPRELVDVAAVAFAASRGDIASTVRLVLGSAAFFASVGLDAEVAARG